MSPTLRALVVLGIVSGFGCEPLLAETLRYRFEVPDRQSAEFEVSFDVAHAGRLSAEVSWAGPRILSFRLQGPGSPPVRFGRSGPSPQRLQPMVTETNVSAGRQWTMTIRALPAKGAAIADLVVETPESAPAVPESTQAPVPPPPPAPPLPSWMTPRAAPASAGQGQRLVFESVEAFRTLVILPGGELRPDACSWQASFLEYAAKRRDRASDAPSPSDPASRGCLRRLAASVRQIETLRTSSDPEVRSPAPDDPDLRIAWKARRSAKVGPVEAELDELFELLHSDRCPDLSAEAWPTRLLACATSCERHFDEQLRTGRDDAANSEVARDQWPLILSAGAALEAIAGPEPAAESTPLP